MSATSNTIQFPVKAMHDPVAEMVEEFVELHNRLSPEMDRYEFLKKELGKLANMDKSSGPMILAGYEHVIDYTAPAESLVCNVGAEQFMLLTGAWNALSVSVTEARKALTPDELTYLFDKKPGSRRFRRIR